MQCRLDDPGDADSDPVLITTDDAANTEFFYSIKKEGTSRIFQAQDRAIEDFTLKGKTKETIIDNLEFIC